MNRRELLATKLFGVGVAAAALAPAIAQDGKTYCGPGPQTLNAAGTLLLLATAEHGADGLRQALAALAQQASAGCVND